MHTLMSDLNDLVIDAQLQGYNAENPCVCFAFLPDFYVKYVSVEIGTASNGEQRQFLKISTKDLASKDDDIELERVEARRFGASLLDFTNEIVGALQDTSGTYESFFLNQFSEYLAQGENPKNCSLQVFRNSEEVFLKYRFGLSKQNEEKHVLKFGKDPLNPLFLASFLQLEANHMHNQGIFYCVLEPYIGAQFDAFFS